MLITGFTIKEEQKDCAHVDFNDKYLDVHFIKLKSYPAKGQHATAKYYVDQNVGEPILVKENDFNNHSLSNISQMTTFRTNCW